MNPEIMLTYLGTAKLLTVVAIAFVYSRSGRGWKWGGWKVRRKVVIPIVLSSAGIVFTICQSPTNWLLYGSWLLSCPILIGVMHIGYGDGRFRRILRSVLRNETVCKVVQRATIGVLYGGACLPVALVTGKWAIYGLSITVACIASITLGVLNPTSASDEETLIGMSEFVFPLFLI